MDMKKLATIALGSILCLGFFSCEEKEQSSQNSAFLRFAPITNAADRIVRIDVSNYGETPYTTTLISYEKGCVSLTETIGGARNSYKYGKSGFSDYCEFLEEFPVAKSIYPEDYIASKMVHQYDSYVYENGSVKFDSEQSDGSKSTGTFTLNDDKTVSSYNDGHNETIFEWTDGNLTAFTAGDGSKTVIEYSLTANPWCGIDVISGLEDLFVPSIVAGHFHSKNVLSKITYYGPDMTVKDELVFESEVDGKGHVKKISQKRNGELLVEVVLFYGSHDASTIHRPSKLSRYVTRQEILEEKFVPSTENNIDFSYDYNIKTEFSDGTEETKWYSRPNKVIAVNAKELYAESWSLKQPEFIELTPLSDDMKIRNDKLDFYQVPVSESESRRLIFKPDTQSIPLDIMITFNTEHGIIYWDGSSRVFHHPYTNPAIRVSKSGWTSSPSQQITYNNKSATMVPWSGNMELDLNGNEGKGGFNFKVEFKLYKYN